MFLCFETHSTLALSYNEMHPEFNVKRTRVGQAKGLQQANAFSEDLKTDV